MASAPKSFCHRLEIAWIKAVSHQWYSKQMIFWSVMQCIDFLFVSVKKHYDLIISIEKSCIELNHIMINEIMITVHYIVGWEMQLWQMLVLPCFFMFSFHLLHVIHSSIWGPGGSMGLVDYLTTRASLSPIRRGFMPGFVNCKLRKRVHLTRSRKW